MGELPRKWIVVVCCENHTKRKHCGSECRVWIVVCFENQTTQSNDTIKGHNQTTQSNDTIKRHNLCKQKQNFETLEQAEQAVWLQRKYTCLTECRALRPNPTPWDSLSEGEPPRQAISQPTRDSFVRGSLDVLRKSVYSVSFKVQSCVQNAGAEGSA